MVRVYHITPAKNDQTLQEAVGVAVNWSKKNYMRLNASKSKEISFAKVCPGATNPNWD